MAKDKFGYGVEQIDEATKNAQRIAKDHMYVWNRLVENKGPIGMKKDEQQWEPRVQDLMSNEGFQTFVKAPTIQAKMVALRDAGIYQGMDMSDEELARFLMTHAASGLTEDPNVHREAKENIKDEWKEPFLKVGKLNKEGTDIEGDPYFSVHRTGTGLIDKINPDLKY